MGMNDELKKFSKLKTGEALRTLVGPRVIAFIDKYELGKTAKWMLVAFMIAAGVRAAYEGLWWFVFAYVGMLIIIYLREMKSKK